MEISRVESGLFVVKGTLDYLEALKSTAGAEERLRDAIGDLFSSVEKELVRQLKDHGIPTSAGQRGHIDLAIEDAAQRYETLVADAAKDAAQAGSKAVAAILVANGISVASDALNDYALAKLETLVFEASRKTIARLVGNINDILVKAQTEGFGIDEVARLLSDGVFDGLRGWEAVRIARTEINSAQNWGAYHTLRDYSRYSMWWTALDGLVRTYGSTGGRADHRKLHGQIVRTGTKFENGLLYPGDRSGPLMEWINCRCRILPFIMPPGKAAPIGKLYFFQRDLITVIPAA